jgi:hypothetical protein
MMTFILALSEWLDNTNCKREQSLLLDVVYEMFDSTMTKIDERIRTNIELSDGTRDIPSDLGGLKWYRPAGVNFRTSKGNPRIE